MKTFRVLVIDDEPIAIEVIKELISYCSPELQVQETATNGMDALEKINTLKPEIVFMDVDMPYLNGLQVLEELEHRSFALVFTTGFATEAIKTMKQQAVDYLLKPIDPEDFVAAVTKAKQRLAMMQQSDNA